MLARFMYVALAVVASIASSYFSGRASEMPIHDNDD